MMIQNGRHMMIAGDSYSTTLALTDAHCRALLVLLAGFDDEENEGGAVYSGRITEDHPGQPWRRKVSGRVAQTLTAKGLVEPYGYCKWVLVNRGIDVARGLASRMQKAAT